MCSCNIKTIDYSKFSLADIMADPKLKNAIKDNTIISASQYANNDPVAFSSLAFCFSPSKVNKALAPYGIEIHTNADAQALGDIIKKGLDKSGKLKHNGKAYAADFFAILKNIQFSNDELTKSSCAVFVK